MARRKRTDWLGLLYKDEILKQTANVCGQMSGAYTTVTPEPAQMSLPVGAIHARREEGDGEVVQSFDSICLGQEWDPVRPVSMSCIVSWIFANGKAFTVS